MKVRYLHSEIDTVERVEIIRDLRLGEFDVLVGINLLREGLDLRKCRWWRSSTPTRKASCAPSARSSRPSAARRANQRQGDPLRRQGHRLDGARPWRTDRRRAKQVAFNEKKGITPSGVTKRIKDLIDGVYDPDEAPEGAKGSAGARRKYEAMSEKHMRARDQGLEKQMLDPAQQPRVREGGGNARPALRS